MYNKIGMEKMYQRKYKQTKEKYHQNIKGMKKGDGEDVIMITDEGSTCEP